MFGLVGILKSILAAADRFGVKITTSTQPNLCSIGIDFRESSTEFLIILQRGTSTNILIFVRLENTENMTCFRHISPSIDNLVLDGIY